MIKKLTIYFLVLPIIFICAFPLQKANANEQMELFSESALIIDSKSGDILYEQDSTKEMYPASITKIVTAIIAIEEGNLDDIVTVSKNASNQEGSSVYLLEGEKITLWKLVQGLMINSGNDAGTAIAEYLEGSENAFAKRMNMFLKEKIGVEHTNFENPHGLFNPKHVTTAQDMAKITQYAMKNDTFRELVGTKEMAWTGVGWETTLYNHHRLLWDYEGTTGVKNGYVPESGHTLVTSAERDGLELIAVILNAESKYYSYLDTMKLLDYGFQHFKTEEIAKGIKIKDASGTNYTLANDIYITKQEKEDISFSVNEKQELVIKVGDREQKKDTAIIEPEKQEMPAFSSQIKESASAHTPNTGEAAATNDNLLAYISIVVGLLFFLIAVSWNKKRLRKKKRMQRFSEEYLSRNKYRR